MTQRGDPVGAACHKTPPVGVVHHHLACIFACAPLSLPKSHLRAAGIAPRKSQPTNSQPLPGLPAASELCRLQPSLLLLLLSQNREPVLLPSPKPRDGNPKGDASHGRCAAQLSSGIRLAMENGEQWTLDVLKAGSVCTSPLSSN